MKGDGITRRDFLKGTVTGVAGLALGAGLPTAGAETAKKGSQSVVAVVRSSEALTSDMQVNVTVCRNLIRQAVMQAVGTANASAAWKKLFKPTDVVGIVTSKAVNPTHMELANLVKEELAAVGVSEQNIKFIQRETDLVKECTALIALPALKAHWLTGIGTVLKLYIMFSGKPSNYHNENSSKLGEIWQMDFIKGKTRLVLIDALRPTCDKGPQVDPRYQWVYGGIIASTDPVAAEAVGLKIIQAKRDEIKGEPWPLSPPPICVAAADKEYKLGTSDLSKIRIKKLGWNEGWLI
ncbi:MAG: DUF362 domain-containing protein [Armatimonadota bacterium]|nr:DUF362 domain-containing protein [Armatimonadota bacterium]